MTCILLITLEVEAGELDRLSCSDELAKFPFEIYIAYSGEDAFQGELIAGVQQEYFNRYNELNRQDQYDVHCYHYPILVRTTSLRYCGTPRLILSRGDVLSALALTDSKQVDRNYASANSDVTNEYELLRLSIEYFTDVDAKFRELEQILLELMSLSSK